MPTLPTLLTIADAGISPVFLASATGGLLTVTVILTPNPNPNPKPKSNQLACSSSFSSSGPSSPTSAS